MKKEESIYKLSVAIVAHDFEGKSLDYFKRLLDSIIMQNLHNFEVIISDQSGNKKFLEVIQETIIPSCIDFKYFESQSTNASENLNFAISKCSSEFIKIMFLDDFFHSPNALSRFNDAFISGAKWVASAQTHWDEQAQHYYRDMVPCWNDQMVSGNNTIGNPSVIAFQHNKKFKFDNRLFYLFDTDFYQFLKNIYGEPYILNEILIATSANNGGASQSIPSQENFNDLLQEELKISYENRFVSCKDCKNGGLNCEIPS